MQVTRGTRAVCGGGLLNGKGRGNSEGNPALTQREVDMWTAFVLGMFLGACLGLLGMGLLLMAKGPGYSEDMCMGCPWAERILAEAERHNRKEA